MSMLSCRITLLLCSCDGSRFIYQPAGHIVTGNVSIVGSNVLKDLLTKGPNYREPRSFSWILKNSIMNTVEDYSRKWAKKEGDDSALSEWIKAIRHLVKRRVYFYVILQELSLCLKIRILRKNWLIYMIHIMLLFMLIKHLTM